MRPREHPERHPDEDDDGDVVRQEPRGRQLLGGTGHDLFMPDNSSVLQHGRTELVHGRVLRNQPPHDQVLAKYATARVA
ncbi:hypothetical protein GCM10023258_21960 [Terrabacter aeriphilus]|uniref:Uncharacterized protein n=1 Tax=Terrabacter aeriphilus TaxID=515662 RepID=A0ABP9JBZ7_9MICO